MAENTEMKGIVEVGRGEMFNKVMQFRHTVRLGEVMPQYFHGTYANKRDYLCNVEKHGNTILDTTYVVLYICSFF